MKYCANCERYLGMGRGEPVCCLPDTGAKPYIVTGRLQVTPRSCERMRSKGIFGLFKGRCGPEGKYFKAREVEE